MIYYINEGKKTIIDLVEEKVDLKNGKKIKKILKQYLDK